jgi:metal-dependent amidase/aminoacylase/carboxypeptidase family protein
MDALELLEEDHEKVKELFDQAEEADEKQQRQIFQRIKTELETHTHIEETVFYPAMEKHQELKKMVSEALKEHGQVKKLLREMDSGLAGDDFESKLKDLMEAVEHHAEDEEEGKMFPKIREILSTQDLEQLGQKLEAAKGQRQRKAG